MKQRDGWLVTEGEDGETLQFKLVNGSPYQVQIDPEGESAMVLALGPGVYDEDLNLVEDDDGGKK